MTALTPLAKQHDAQFSIVNDDGTEEPIEVAKTSGQKHADRVAAAQQARKADATG